MRLFLQLVALAAALGCSERRPEPTAAPGVLRFGPAPPAAPRRIVSLAPNATEVLFALGAGAQVVGVTRYCDYPPEALALPKIGGFLDPSLEPIIALRPDFVVGAPNSSNRPVVQRLAELGIPVLLIDANRIDDVYLLIRELGGASGRREGAERLVAAMQARVRATEAAVGDAPRPRVLLAYGRSPLVVAGPGSFADELLRRAGAENVVREGSRYPSYSMERVLRLAPEVIIDSSMGTGGARPTPEALRERWGRLTSLPAVKTGRLYWLDPQLYARPGPRLVDALEALARLLHPERVKGL